MAEKKSKHDPANYRKMSEPFPTVEEANEALSQFYEAVEVARKQHKIMDVHVIVKMNISDGVAMTTAHYGNELEAAPMCAWALGQAQADFESILRGHIKASPVVGK